MVDLPKSLKKVKLSRVLLHIGLFITVMVVFYPVAWVIGVSFSPDNNLVSTELQIFPSNPTFKNYKNVLTGDFYIYLWNSLVASIGTTFFGLTLATSAAYGFSRFRFRAKKTFMLAFLLVQMFPGVIILIPYYIMFSYIGLRDTLLGLILIYSVTALPLCVWMIKGFFDTIPRDLEEAAMMDGCSQFGAFVKIILPLAKPAIAVTALFSFIAAWNEYLLAYVFMSESKNYTLAVRIFSYVSGQHTEWGLFAAMSVIISIPVVALFIAFQKYLISGLTAGGVKG